MSPSPEYLAFHEQRLAKLIEELHLSPELAQQYRAAYLQAARNAYGTQDSMLSEPASLTSSDPL